MGSRRRHDAHSIRRRGPTREPKQRILIVCEGEETERGYFKAFQHEARNPRVHVEVASETGEPLQVVQIAVRLKEKAEGEARSQHDENLRWDEVWGVVDVDEHASLDKARQLALNNDIFLAISNPCFELWALLHFQEQRAHLERDKAQDALRRHLPGYDKELDFQKLHPGYGDAVRRAQALEVEAERQAAPGRNPTTGVHRLTESIRKGGSS
jgi:hypothetical protein